MASENVDKDPLIEIRDIHFRYGRYTVLSGITFSIHSGDFLAVIGPNGSGKTTLIRIILGLIKPDGGKILIQGIPVQDFSHPSMIGYIPQKAAFFDPFFPASVKEVVAMGLEALRPGKARRSADDRVDQALERVGMIDLRERRIGQLSGGQQQRALIARAIVHNPRILFLDEPTTGVDADTQDRFFEMLGDLNENAGITIVLITHETGIIDRHVRQVACLNRRLFYHGTHEEFCRTSAFKKMLEEGHHVIHHRH